MSRITNAALKEECENLITYALTHGGIPYVKGGASLAGMDCQSAAEYVLIQAGIPASECNLSGSNSHYRKCRWVGTPEECCSLLGVSEVPVGFMMFIHDDDGEEPAKYQGDGKGNASHMGWYLGGGRTFNSSEKNGGVVISTKFNGHSTVPHGGWNMCGLSCWVECGLSEAQMAALDEPTKTEPSAVPAQPQNSSENASPVTEAGTATPVSAAPADTDRFFTVKRGCKGGAVERLQTWLNDLGYPLSVDHDFGPATDAAVRAFQQAQGLDADGIVGKKTWAVLATARQAAAGEVRG